jgi:hypothetical protein
MNAQDSEFATRAEDAAGFADDGAEVVDVGRDPHRGHRVERAAGER